MSKKCVQLYASYSYHYFFSKRFFFVYVHACIFVLVSHMYECPQRPEDGIKSFEAVELQVIVSLMTWVLGPGVRYS